MKDLKKILLGIEEEDVSHDPIHFAYRFQTKEDKEVASIVASLFAYGNVSSIFQNLEKIFKFLGDSPSKTLVDKRWSRTENEFQKYRFQTSKDISDFFLILRELFLENKTFEHLFIGENTQKRILNFQKSFWEVWKKNYPDSKPSNGLQFLVGKGLENSPNKRYNLFLRWMVRNSFPDLGLYKSISQSDLIYPLDTHIQKFAKILNLNTRKASDYKTAFNITEKFKELEPEDPLRFDFPLARMGILKSCKSRYVPELCNSCKLRTVCVLYKTQISNLAKARYQI
ncbi:MAG: TIGR02757 family protein [Leptospiraceae bacterium]|nr:TIGR02757 family protein [Leptospiraceae bacterium]